MSLYEIGRGLLEDSSAVGLANEVISFDSYLHTVSGVEDYIWIPIVGGITCAFMAWGIGANDAANSWGTSFGSNSVTLVQAVILAAIFESAGAFALGTNVSSTVKRKVIGFETFCTDDYSRVLRMLGMWAVLISAGTCLLLSSCYGVPVSTTHAAVGGTAGFGIVTRGFGAVSWWPALGKIGIAWITGPLVGATGGFILMAVFKKFVVGAPAGQVWRRTVWLAPILAALTVAVTALFAVKVGGKRSFAKEMEWWAFVAIFFGTWIVAALPAWAFYRWYIPFLGLSKTMSLEDAAAEDAEVPSVKEVEGSFPAYAQYPQQPQPAYLPPTPTGPNMPQYSAPVPQYAGYPNGAFMAPVPNADQEMEVREEAEADPLAGLSFEVASAERLFRPLAVLIACGESFAHGANDVGNAIGPYAALMDSWDNNCPKGGDVQYWLLAVGAAGIVVGLATLGWKVMDTIGKKVTKVTPSRAFITELSATISIMIATEMSIPVSTSHTSVGALTGMALAQGGVRNVNWKIIGMVLLGIVLTVPGTALYAGALTAFLHAIVFGAAYPPNYIFCTSWNGTEFCAADYYASPAAY